MDSTISATSHENLSKANHNKTGLKTLLAKALRRADFRGCLAVHSSFRYLFPMTDKETTNYYRERATEYEQIYYRDNPARRQEIADEVIRLQKLVAGRRVLELACGTGYWTAAMAETASHVTALDIWPEMIAEAKKKLHKGAVEFLAGDMFTYPIPEKAFDVVAVGFWFSHQPRQEYEMFFDVITRPLRDGGRIWLIDNNPPAEGGKGHEFVRKDEFGNSYKRRNLENGTSYVILKNYFDEAELRGILSSRFEIERLVYKTYYWSVVVG